jgi:hypothetical protein
MIHTAVNATPCRPERLQRASLAVLLGIAASACSGPDLTPTILPVREEPVPLVIPPGGYCAPVRQASQPASELAEGEAEPSPGVCEGGAMAMPSQHTPLRPLGVGYQEGDNPIPPRMAYLTFDDGPSEWTHQFLDILAQKGVKATFFVTAKQFKGEAGLEAT